MCAGRYNQLYFNKAVENVSCWNVFPFIKGLGFDLYSYSFPKNLFK